MTGDGAGGGHLRTHQVGAREMSLTAFEISIRGRCTTLFRIQPVVVHGQAHGAAGLTPLEAGLDEVLVDTLLLGLALHQSGARDNHGELDVVGQLVAAHNASGSAQIVDAAIGAGTDEDLVHHDIRHGQVRFQTHVLEGTLHSLAPKGIALVLRVRDALVDADDHLR